MLDGVVFSMCFLWWAKVVCKTVVVSKKILEGLAFSI